MSGNVLKHSYTIPCSSAFRDAVIELAGRAKVNVADLARSVVLMAPAEAIAAFPDPGEPDAKDREIVILKSGSAKGRPWRRKPRLQVRMAPKCDVVTIRRALGLALAMDRGEKAVRFEGAGGTVAASVEKEETDLIRETREELERLRAMISLLSFEPLPDGVTSREDALHILGFSPGSMPDYGAVKARFRMLATVHHPDGAFGSHNRMSQLNAAMERLRRNAA